jgi:hypothetical protein
MAAPLSIHLPASAAPISIASAPASAMLICGWVKADVFATNDWIVPWEIHSTNWLWAQWLISNSTTTSMAGAVQIWDYPGWAWGYPDAVIPPAAGSRQWTDTVTVAQATGHIWVATMVVDDVANSQVIIRQWRKYGVDGDLQGPVTTTWAYTTVHAAWTPADFAGITIGEESGETDPLAMTAVRVYEGATVPDNAALTALSNSLTADATAWADWKLVWQSGAAVLTDQSGHSRTLTANQTLTQGPAGPIDPNPGEIGLVGKSALASGTTGTTRTPDGSAIGLQTGHFLVCTIFLRYTGAGTATITMPAGEGWQLMPNGRQSLLTNAWSVAHYWKPWGAGNTDDTTPTITVTGASKWGAILHAYSNVNLTSPFGADAQATATSSTMTTPAVTVPSTGHALLRMFASTDNNSPNTASEGAAVISGTNVNVNSGSGYALGVSLLGTATAGDSGTATMAQTANGADVYYAFTYALAPASSATTYTAAVAEAVGEDESVAATEAAVAALGETEADSATINAGGSTTWTADVAEAVGSAGAAATAASVAAGVAESGSVAEAVAGTNAVPTMGAHTIAFKDYGSAPATLTTPAMTTVSGGAIVAFDERYPGAASLQPTDSKGNTYAIVGSTIENTDWPGSFGAIYASLGITGGSGHTLTVGNSADDEVTIFCAELRNVDRIISSASAMINATSLSVATPSITVDGPAVIVAVFFCSVQRDSQSFSGCTNGFTIIETQPLGAQDGSGAMAYREVSAPGTYSTAFNVGAADNGLVFIIAFGRTATGTLYTASVSESEGVAESAATVETAKISAAEAEVSAESAAVATPSTVSQAEPEASGENITAAATDTVAAAETEATGEAVATTETATVSAAEAETQAEAATAGRTVPIVVNEAASAAESAAVVETAPIAANEAEASTESAAAVATGVVAGSESEGVAEANQVTGTATVAQAEAEAAAEVVTGGRTVPVAVAESEAGAESVVVAGRAPIAVNEAENEAETVSTNVNQGSTVYTADVAETGATAEAATVAGTASSPLTDAETSTESAAAKVAASIPLAEAVASVGELVIQGIGVIPAAESLGLSENMTGGMALAAALAEVEASGESMGSVVIALTPLIDAAAAGETITAKQVASALEVEGIALSEGAAGGLAYAINVSDSGSVADLMGSAAAYAQTAAESASLTESAATKFTSTMGLAETLASSERATGGIAYAVEVFEQMATMGEVAAAARANPGLADNASVADALAAFQAAYQKLDDAMAIVEDVRAGRIQSIALEDAVELADAASVARTTGASLNDAIAEAEATVVERSGETYPGQGGNVISISLRQVGGYRVVARQLVPPSISVAQAAQPRVTVRQVYLPN